MNVTTPTNCTYAGEVVDADQMVVISIMRAGDSMLSCFLSVAPEATVGKILIQRNEETAEPQLYYSKLPSLVDKDIVLLDPMLATGGSALAALKVLVDNGAERNRISFLNVVSCPEGLKRLLDAFPDLQIVTGQIDERLNEKVRAHFVFFLLWKCSLRSN